VSSGAKRGFSIPVLRWVVGRWRAAVEESFRDSVSSREGWLRARAVLEQVQQAAARGQATNHLWYCYVLECWLRQQQGPAEAAPARMSA
jgi:hypothetical protein